MSTFTALDPASDYGSAGGRLSSDTNNHTYMILKAIAHTRWLGVLVLLLTSAITAVAQTTIRGQITDGDNDETLIGANIIVPGTTIGTSTDFDGNFELTVPEGTTELQVSYAGYGTQMIALTPGQTTYDLTMSAGELLDEVVVVGYGSVRREDLTGAIAAVGERDFQTGVIVSPEQLIQGRVAGVQISENSGEPGSGVSVRIRGTSSVRGGNNPLYVVDGVPLAGQDLVRGGDAGVGSTSARNPLAFINPNDIESISILKDASAAAIYGSRGANGVVIVTTKRGKAGQQPVQFNASVGFSSPATTLDLLQGQEYIDAAVRAGADPTSADQGSRVDYQDEIFRTGIAQNYGISFGGGAGNTTYRFSGSYLDQDGIIENSALERFTGRLSATHKFWEDRADFNVQLTASRVNDQFAPISNDAGFEGDLLGAALKANPTIPIRNDDSLMTFRQSQDFRNPVALLAYIDDRAQTTRLLSNTSFGLNLTDELRLQTTLGYDRSNGTRYTSRDRRLFVGGDVDGVFDGANSISNTVNNNRLWENTLSLNRNLGDNPLSLVVGYAYQRFETSFVSAGNSRSTVGPGTFGYDDLNAVESPDRLTSFSERFADELQSFFGRASYSLLDKYLFTATVRRDGSSKFGENNKYGTFPSFSVAWRLSEEAFMPESIYDLKLRVGYGIVGNQEFPGLQNVAIEGGDQFGGRTSGQLPNPDLKWESTSQFNVGLDYGFAGGRVLGSLDFFNKVTSDLLFFREQPLPTPGSARSFENLDGEVVNNGVELSIDIRAIDRGDFSWQTIFTGAYLTNEVRDLVGVNNTGAIRGQGLTGAFAQQVVSGQPLFVFYMPVFEGFDSEGRNILANNGFSQYVGDPIPDFNLGLNNSFTYGDFDFSFFLQGVFGFQVYNNTANAFFLQGNLATGRNTTVESAAAGESNDNPGIVSTRFLEDGDFLRIQNVNLGYNLPLPSNRYVSSARFYVTGQNLYNFTGYSGYDPEVNNDANINGIPSLGIDYTAYPRARTFLFGLNLGF